MRERERGAAGEVVIRFTDTFDAGTARDLERVLGGMPSGECVALDFSCVHDMGYYAIAALADVISHACVRVLLRGLSRGQVRMLRYFGLDPVAFGVGEAASADVG
jgi:hypothetical protein